MSRFEVRKKQVVTVVDDSFFIVQITLWEAWTGTVEGKEIRVVEFQNLEIKDFWRESPKVFPSMGRFIH